MKYFLRFWVIILVLSGLLSCWFVSQAVKEGWRYFRLNAQVPAQILKWEVKMLSPSQYAISANYSYMINNHEFKGESLLDVAYPNLYAAESSLKIHNAEDWHAWYQKKHPTFSSLQKKIPRKEFVNAFLTLGVFTYFCLSRSFLRRL